MDRRDLIRIARKFHAKKHLGQNFLVDPPVLERISAALELTPADSVLEIGPGLGFLTSVLSRTGARVTGVELDIACVEHLRGLQLPGVSIVHADFLQFDPRTLAAERIKIVGNVPYQITAPIIARLFGEIGSPAPWFPLIETLVMTVQKEVAERLVASPGDKDYSQITLLATYFASTRILTIVPPDHFYPEPEVTSAVIELVPRPESAVSCMNVRLLRQVIRAGFGQRRKMLKNNLGFLRVSSDELMTIFNRLHFDPQVRAENLSLAQFAMLADALETAHHR